MTFKSLLILTFMLVTGLAGQAPAQAQAQGQSSQIRSFTLEGGPIATKHFQTGSENFRERHGIAIAKVHTKDYGNWGVYFLNPNSVDDTSFGAGYVTNPYVVPIWNIDLELSGALGFVTGYQDYPLPLIAGEARLVLYDRKNWDVGASVAALPYYAQDTVTTENNVGIVMTTPFLSVRYNFQ